MDASTDFWAWAKEHFNNEILSGSIEDKKAVQIQLTQK